MKRLLLPLLFILLIGGCRPGNDSDVVEISEEVTIANKVEIPSQVVAVPSASPSASGVVIEGPLEEVDWGSLVGREVTIRDLVIVDTYSLLRFGQLTMARDRLQIPTSVVDPNDADPSGTTFEGGPNVAPVIAMDKRNKSAVIVVDDINDRQNVFPPTLLPSLGADLPTVRLGGRVPVLSGIVSMERGKPLLRVSEPLRLEPAPRPSRPDLGDPDWTIASFNVLNFFTTIDDGKNGARGADSQNELTRQRDKIVAAIIALDADVIGLMELQNDAESERDLVQSLNNALGADRYAGCGVPSNLSDYPGGTDAIRVGIIYRKDKVEPVGDSRWIRDNAFYRARTPMVQTFLPLVSNDSIGGTGNVGKPNAVTLVVNHFKSKGGAADADQANKDKGDGQAAYNATRRAQSLAVAEFIESEFSDNDRVLVIGDLNAYSQEDPIDALRSKGLVDLTEIGGGATSSSDNFLPPYSYVYYGQCGSLDHALATPSLAKSVTTAAVWNINSDEPVGLDYNQEFNPAALYQPDLWRSSDHDPILIGIRN